MLAWGLEGSEKAASVESAVASCLFFSEMVPLEGVFRKSKVGSPADSLSKDSGRPDTVTKIRFAICKKRTK